MFFFSFLFVLFRQQNLKIFCSEFADLFLKRFQSKSILAKTRWNIYFPSIHNNNLCHIVLYVCWLHIKYWLKWILTTIRSPPCSQVGLLFLFSSIAWHLISIFRSKALPKNCFLTNIELRGALDNILNFLFG